MRTGGNPRRLGNCNVIVTTFRCHSRPDEAKGESRRQPMKTFSPTPSRRAPRAFTLVELLSVMGIISVLLAVTIPALKGLHGAGSRKSAVRTLMGALDQARMLAISDGRATYVVLAGPPLAGRGPQVEASLFGRAYAIFEDNADFEPVQRTQWLYLPKGVSFKIKNDGGSTASLMNRPASQATPDPAFAVKPPGSDSAAVKVQLPYVRFDSTGAPDIQQADYLRILLYEGFNTAPDIEVSTRKVTGAGQQRSGLDEVRINPATGRAKYILSPADNLQAQPAT